MKTVHVSLAEALRDAARTARGLNLVLSRTERRRISYCEIYEAALRTLGALQNRGIPARSRIIVQLHDSADFLRVFWACVLGGHTPIPLASAYREHVLRFCHVWARVGAAYLATTRRSFESLCQQAEEASQPDVLRSLRTRAIFVEELIEGPTAVPADIDPAACALIQFSSGSTGDPKGVVLSHRNVLATIEGMCERTKTLGREETLLNWMPLTHDMGLIGFHISPVVRAWEHYLMPTETFQRDPLLWLQELSINAVTISGTCNSGLEYVLERFRTAGELNLDLSSLKILFNGAEPISPPVCQKFIEAFGRFGLKKTAMYPVYGLAEATLGVTFPFPGEELKTIYVDRRCMRRGEAVRSALPTEAQAFELVELGAPVDCCRLRLADENAGPLPERTIGRIQVRGDSVTAGYFADPAANAKAFTHDGWFDTGDVGFLHNKRLVVTGRVNDILFMNGQNYYPDDLERIASEAIKMNSRKIAVVSCFDARRRRDIIVVFVAFRRPRIEFLSLVKDLKSCIMRQSGALIAHVLPVAHMPRTTSGKIQRFKLAERFAAGQYDELIRQIEQLQRDSGCEMDELASSDEARVIAIWQQALPRAPLKPADNFFELGGDSLCAARIAHAVAVEFGREVPSQLILEKPVVRDFTQALKKCARSSWSESARAEQRECYPAGPDQKRLYAIQKTNEATTAYNLPLALRLQGNLDTDRLSAALQTVVARHESLRAHFCAQRDDISIRILHDVELRLRRKTATPATITQEIIKAIVPFDLDRAPPFRATLFGVGEQEHILLCDAHHAFLDGASLIQVVQDVADAYSGRDLPVPGRFADVAVWRSRIGAAASVQNREYWENKLAGALPILDLPADYPRREMVTFAGDAIEFSFSANENQALKRLAAGRHTTVFMVLLTLFELWLARLTGQEELFVGVPVNSRNPRTTQCVGMFVNTIVLRQRILCEQPFIDLLRVVQGEFSGSMKHLPCPLDGLAARVSSDRRHNALFDAMFVFQDMEMPSIRFEGLSASHIDLSRATAKFDLTLEVWNRLDPPVFRLEFNTDLFRRDSAEHFARQFAALARAVIADPGAPVAGLTMMDSRERDFVLYAANDTEVNVGKPVPVHVLFEQQAVRSPQSPALFTADGRQMVTYGELNERANAVARSLRRAAPDGTAIAAVYLERSTEMVAAVLATLKAGFAYLPIEPDWPLLRKQQALQETQANLVVTSSRLAREAKQFAETLVLADGSHVEEQSDLRLRICSRDLAYVIFTSGTQGKPKGVMVSHGALSRYANWASQVYLRNRPYAFALHTPLSFDLTVTSIFVPLVTGNGIVVYPTDDPVTMLNAILDDPRVGVIKLTPAHLRLIHKRRRRARTHVLILGGENLPSDLARDAVANLNPALELYNEYGPTEATVGCMFHRFDPDRDLASFVPIGRPADNTKIYLLDASRSPVPIGASGEIYISSAALAGGYLGDARLTEDRFVANPFVSGTRMYRTGDVGKRRSDGTIVYMGRIDQQLKIRGHRIDPEEIRTALLQHAAIEDALVLSEQYGDEPLQLHAYVLLSQPVDAVTLREFLKAYLPPPLIPAAFSEVDQFPLTTNGKIDRQRLRREGRPLNVGILFDPPQSELEITLANIWKDVLRAPRVGRNDNFFDLGGDSIKALLVASRCAQAGIGISVKQVLQRQTIKMLSVDCQSVARQTEKRAHASGGKWPTPLELRFWKRNFPQPQYYCQSLALRFRHRIDETLLRNALQAVLRHHDGLRVNHDPVQKRLYFNARHLEQAFPLQIRDLSGLPKRALQDEIMASCCAVKSSLKLCEDLLFRGVLFKTGASDVLVLIGHHFVVDGFSWRILLEDLRSAYCALRDEREPEFPAVRASVQDHAIWLAGYAESPSLHAQAEFWQAIHSRTCNGLDCHSLNVGTREARFELDTEDTITLVGTSRSVYRTDPATILLVAVVRLLRERGIIHPIVELEHHGRSLDGIDLHRTVGWLTAMYPVRLDCLDCCGANEEIKAVKERLRRIPEDGVGYGVLAEMTNRLIDLPGRAHVDARINYLGEFAAEADNELFTYGADLSTGADISPENPLSADLEINALLYCGKLLLILRAAADRVAHECAKYREHLARVLQEMRAQGGEMQFTPADFEAAQLEQADLDAILR